MPFVMPPYHWHGSATRSGSPIAPAMSSASLIPESPYFDGE
jgi:hypothetical protein